MLPPLFLCPEPIFAMGVHTMVVCVLVFAIENCGDLPLVIQLEKFYDVGKEVRI